MTFTIIGWNRLAYGGQNDERHQVDEHGHEHPKHELSHQAKRIYAIRDLLLEKGVITEKDIQCQIEYQEARSPANGAKIVARAWVDPEFKARLIADPKTACAELGIDATALNEFVVLENTEKVRHMVVCTLVLLLSQADSGPAARLVQELQLSAALGERSARRHA